MKEKLEQIKTVFSDDAFVQTCLEAENEEAVQKLLADKGVEMSLTEIEMMKEMIAQIAEGGISQEFIENLPANGELTEEDLAEVAGGDGNPLFNYFFDGDKISYDEYIANLGELDVYKSLNAKGWGTVVGGVLLAGGAAYGICKACGVDVEGGVSKAWNWVSDKVTSRW